MDECTDHPMTERDFVVLAIDTIAIFADQCGRFSGFSDVNSFIRPLLVENDPQSSLIRDLTQGLAAKKDEILKRDLLPRIIETEARLSDWLEGNKSLPSYAVLYHLLYYVTQCRLVIEDPEDKSRWPKLCERGFE